MKLKNIYRWLYTLFFSLLFFIAGPQNASAKGFSEREIILADYGSIAISPIIQEETLFNAISVEAEDAIQELSVNFRPLDGGAWEPVILHNDGFGPQTLIFTEPTKTVQFRKTGGSASEEITLKADFIFVSADNDSTENLYSGPEIAASGINIIKRSVWGADESIRYWTPDTEELLVKNSGDGTDYTDPCEEFNEKYSSEVKLSRVVKTGANGEQLIWPLAYSANIEKFIIHHTDTELRDLTGDKRTDGRDYNAMVQAIYYYHSITRRWGDIGYNYIIDPLGNVYEGRYGGEKVIGAHAQCYNNGSIGIALIGNYEDNSVPEPAFNALVTLVAQKAKIYNIDPEGDSVFRGKSMSNIIGHSDVRATSCPGKKLSRKFSEIRERAAFILRSGIFKDSDFATQILDYNAEFEGDLSTVSLLPAERKKITLKFKNTGKETWDQNTWLHVSLNNRKSARVVSLIEDKPFVAADMREKSVAPGKTATFDVELEAGYFSANLDFEMSPVANGRYKVSRAAVFVSVYIKEPSFSYEVAEQDLPKGKVFQGQELQGSITLKNTGNVTWRNYGENPIRIGTEDLRDRRSLLVKTHSTRLAHLKESEVSPGEKGTFLFDLEAPVNYEGTLKERFSPVVENASWLEDKGLGFEVTVKKPTHSAKVISKTEVSQMLPGEMKKIEISLENSGDLPWDQNNMRITFINRGMTIFKKSMYPSETVSPKKDFDFNFWVQAPYKEGRHTISLKPRFNRLPIKGGAAQFIINVPRSRFTAKFESQSSREVSIKPGEEKEVEVTFKNTGNVVWRNKGQNAIYLAPTRPQDRLSSLYYSTSWINKYRAAALTEEEVGPGETGTFRFKIKLGQKGIFRENFQLVIEQVGWIDNSYVRWDFNVSGEKAGGSSGSAKVSKVTSTKPSATSSNTDAGKISVSSDQEGDFRMMISYESDNSKITADKDFKVYDENDSLLFSADAWKIVELRRMSGNIHAQMGDSTKTAKVMRFIPEAGGIIKIPTMERRPSWNQNLNDNMFRGTMEVRVADSKAVYINELPLEDYLKGLAEVTNSDSGEKQKVIAILARTYARFYMSDENRKFPGMPYDGSDDPAVFQRYLGYGVESRSPNFVSAVKATEDMVVTYNGKLVKTPYFNQSDGKTRSAEEVWGWTNTPYLKSVSDPYCEGLTMNGHGVGLSGFGAAGMAKNGKTYEEIIKYYYQGVEIEKLQW